MKRSATVILLLAAFAMILRYELYSRNGTLMLGDRLHHGACAVTWSDFSQLCWPKVALLMYRTGLVRSSEKLYLRTHMHYEFLPITDGLARPCTNHKVIHVGNSGTTFGLDDGRVFGIQPAEYYNPGNFAKRNKLRPGASIQICYYKSQGKRTDRLLTKVKGLKDEVFAFQLR